MKVTYINIIINILRKGNSGNAGRTRPCCDKWSRLRPGSPPICDSETPKILAMGRKALEPCGLSIHCSSDLNRAAGGVLPLEIYLLIESQIWPNLSDIDTNIRTNLEGGGALLPSTCWPRSLWDSSHGNCLAHGAHTVGQTKAGLV